MPDVGMPLSPSSPSSHTSTQQWQSFEIKMRYRRAERCIARADAALAAGREDEARATLAEARALNPEAPSFEAMAAAVHQREAAAAAATRARRQRMAAAAVLAMAVAAGSAGVWWRTGTGIEDTAATAAPAQASSPSADPAPPPKRSASTPPQSPVETAARPVAPPADVPVRTSGSDRSPSDTATQTSGVTVPDSAPARPAEPPLPPVQEVNPSLTLERPAAEAAITSVSGPDGLVKTLPSTELPAVTIPPPPPPKAAAEARPAESPAVSEEPKVRAVLAQFEAAYTSLSAAAAQVVWPSVDARALGRAFDSLESQQVSLGRCAIQINGTTARAECSGTATWTPKIGGGRRSGPRRWEFDLAAQDGAWHIVQALAR